MGENTLQIYNRKSVKNIKGKPQNEDVPQWIVVMGLIGCIILIGLFLLAGRLYLQSEFRLGFIVGVMSLALFPSVIVVYVIQLQSSFRKWTYGSISPEGIVITDDHHHRTWFGTQSEGLFVLDQDRRNFRNYRHDPADPNSLSNNWPLCAIEDQNNYLWITSVNGGLNVADLDRNYPDLIFHKYSHDPDDSSSIYTNDPWIIYEDNNKDIWIGGNRGGGIMKAIPPQGKGKPEISDYTFENLFLPPLGDHESFIICCMV